MEPTYITWNVTNWITIFLMVVLGFFALGLISQMFKSATKPKVEADATA